MIDAEDVGTHLWITALLMFLTGIIILTCFCLVEAYYWIFTGDWIKPSEEWMRSTLFLWLTTGIGVPIMYQIQEHLRRKRVMDRMAHWREEE